MGVKEYLQALAIIEGAIQTLEELNPKNLEEEAIDYVYGRLLRLKRETENEMKDILIEEIDITSKLKKEESEKMVS